MKEYSILGRRVIPFSVGVYLAWQSFARANDVAPDNICIQLTNVYVHNKVKCSEFRSNFFNVLSDGSTFPAS